MLALAHTQRVMHPTRFRSSLILTSALATLMLVALLVAQGPRPDQGQLWHHRKLGLAPDSIRERINYGLALLRAGDMTAGVAELQKAQKSDPKIPHTWFNLGVALKKEGEMEAALAQFQGMVRLVSGEPVTHYQIGSILKARGDQAAAVKEFETARGINPRLAAPHFQLYGLYRQLNRPDEAAAELRIFQDLKKQQEGAAVPEDMEWSYYAEIYDPIDGPTAPPLAPPVFRSERIAG